MEKAKGVLAGIEPQSVFKYFEQICAIPHGSGNTKMISDYCVEFAKRHGLLCYQDEKNNIIIKKEASQGYEKHPPVIIQGHLDMVCEKEADCDIDFSKDGLDICLNGDMISAKGTTLGADDGIAIAMAMSLLADNTLWHPAIEALFTVDEETGMYGAAALDVSRLNGKMLLNIDSEVEGVLTAGCAGGARTDIGLPLTRESSCGECFKITLDGFAGGHSGIEIAKSVYNSNIIMGSFLQLLEGDWRIADISGGLKDNAIPVLTECVLVAESQQIDRAVAAFCAKYKDQIGSDFKIKAESVSPAAVALTSECSKAVSALLGAVPNGVIEMSSDIEGLVQTSLNLGILKIKGDLLCLSFAVRSSVKASKLNLIERLKRVAQDFGCSFEDFAHYPAWEYRKDSPLREKMVSVYERLFGKRPYVDVIHAGLECGILSEKIGDLDAVSFGPDLYDIHTARERMSVSSVGRTYKFLTEVLKEL